MGAPLIKFDYVIVSLSPTCAFYLPHRLLSLPFLLFLFLSTLSFKKMRLGETDVGGVTSVLCTEGAWLGGPGLDGARDEVWTRWRR